MPPRQWEPIVEDFSVVMKKVHLLFRRDQVDIENIYAEIFREKREAYEDGLAIQAANVGCAGRRGITPPDVMKEISDEAHTEAAGIANTYNYDLALAVRAIRTETPRANRWTYAKRLGEWEATRDEWKSKQISLWNQMKWQDRATRDFMQHNPQALKGWAKVEPSGRAVCDVCQYWVNRGKVSIDETRKQEWPAHLNCPHYWDVHYTGKVDCKELWLGAPLREWWEGKEIGEKGGPGSGNWGHAGRPGMVGGSAKRSVAMSIRTGRDWQERQQAAKKMAEAQKASVAGVEGECKRAIDEFIGDISYGPGAFDNLVEINDDDIKAMFGLGHMDYRADIKVITVGEHGNVTRLEIDYYDADGSTVANVARELRRMGGEEWMAYNELLDVMPEYQDKGIATSLYNRQIYTLRNAGASEIQLYANISIGRYAWAKKGFDYKEGSKKYTLRRVNSNFRKWADDKGIPEPSGGWPTFDSAHSVATYSHPTHTVKGSDIYNDDVADDYVMHLGKAFMLELHHGHGPWNGVLKLN